MMFRRHRRWIILFAAVVGIVYVYTNSPEYSYRRPHFKSVKSSYDWSKLEFHHPIPSIQPLPSGRFSRLPRIQHKQTLFSGSAAQKERQEAVKNTLLKSWKSYKQFAWMRDELTPVTGGAKNTFGGWAATAVDALDTLWIMGLKSEFYEAAQAIVGLDWSTVDGSACNLFETTIRHLGGLLAAYDLSKVPALLEKATDLGDMLYSAFDTPSHMPPFWLDYDKAKTGELVADDHQPSASAGSLSLEFTYLSQLTNNNKYYDAIARVSDRLYESQNETLLPGMWPTFFDLRNGYFTLDNTFTLGALSDSLYEYVFKMSLLLGGTEPRYQEMYLTAADTIIKHILFKPMTPENLDILFPGTLRVNEDGGHEFDPEGQHLACFTGGMFAMGGRIFGIPEHVDVGARLTKGCIWAYDSFTTGIMPEIFGLVPCGDSKNCIWDKEKWHQSMAESENRSRLPKGFSNARDPRYILRPEALESVFILHRITGDEVYRDAAWRMFQHIDTATKTRFGNSAIDDVTKLQPTKLDSQESFWLSETLKYAYLIFSSSSYISLDEYVFNTEAHPLRIPKG